MTPWRPSAQWVADSKQGFLGRRPPSRGGTPQPLHKGVSVDLSEALTRSGPALQLWRAHQLGAPLYSGGVVDAWPAWAVDALQVAAEEMAAIRAFLTWEAMEVLRG